MMPVMHLIAGPHGAGKSTLYRTQIGPRYSRLPFVDVNNYANTCVPDEDSLRRRNELARAWGDECCIELLEQSQSFVTETTFSDPSRLALLTQAQVHGFTTSLYAVCVDEPGLLQARVRQRVGEAAPGLATHEVLTCYARTLALFKDAVAVAEFSMLFDGTDTAHNGPVLVASVTGGHRKLHTALRPMWVDKVLGLAEA